MVSQSCIAWIGAWYPLDTLINYTRPYRQTRKVLQALRKFPVVVRPDGMAGESIRDE